MSDELKPCPFCGNVPTGFEVTESHSKHKEASPNCCHQYEIGTNVGFGVTDPARIQSAFAAHWNAMHRASGWISVEDRLPEDPSVVQVAVTDAHGAGEAWYSLRRRAWINCLTEEDERITSTVTHWQPLAELPK